jgi:lipoprotein
MKKILFSALVGAMMISCSRDNDDTGSVTNDTSILPTKMTYSETNGKIVYTFSYNGNKLMKITDGFYDEIFTYTRDLITSINYTAGKSFVFNYDSNGNLISEKYVNYNTDKIKTSEYNITYAINGSTVTAQSVAKYYSQSDEVLSITSNITYTLDEKKRPIKKVVVYEKKDIINNITYRGTNTFTFQYPNHHGFSENIKGMDKLYYSYFAFGINRAEDLNYPVAYRVYLPFSYFKEEMYVTRLYPAGIPSPHGFATDEGKIEYVVNAHNYPTRIKYKFKSGSGEFESTTNDGYFTVEYNK